MCGIAGIFAYAAGAERPAESELIAMRDRMAARGPDASGAYTDPTGRIALGHRRLSIIDRSEGGAQPMVRDDGGLALVFNGEIYNHRELRGALEAKGHRFRSSSDTEVLLELYRAEGDAMFARLRGMYAFALWDGARGALLVARDPYGIKPLYLADDGKTLRFASEVKALLGGKVSREESLAGLAGFYLLGSVPEPHTRYRAIRALEAGTCQWFDARGAGPVRRHFSVAAVLARAGEAVGRGSIATPVDDAALGREVALALADSVQHHLVADVPVGAFLSAGIDSAALVALMRDAGSQEIRTLTLGFDALHGTTADEVPLAEATARRYGTTHTTVHLGSSDLVTARDAFLAAMDQPTIDGFNTFLVSRAAHEAGLKVAVSGLGADELFAGYPSFRTLPRWVRGLAPTARVPALGRTVEAAYHRLGLAKRLPGSPKLGSMLRYGGAYPGAYLLRRGLFLPTELPRLMGQEAARAGLEALAPLELLGRALEPEPHDDFAKVAALEGGLYLRNQLLRDSDWASMAHGLEIRVPFVDATLLERLAPALVAARLTGRPGLGKRLVGLAPRRPLPREQLERKKTGFFVPMAPLLDDPGGPLDGWRRFPELLQPRSHWSRRLAVALVARGTLG